MGNWRSLLLVGVIAYLLFLVAGTPASRVDAWTQSPERKVGFEGLSGTVWAGHADAVHFPAQSWHNIRWRIRPSGLLLGRLEYRVKSRDEEGRGALRIGRDLLGRTLFGEGRVQLAARRLEPLVPVRLAGSMEAEIADGVIADGERWVEGRLVWRSAAVTAQSVTAALGDLQLVAKEKDGGMSGTLTDLGDKGPFDVDAVLELTPDGTFALEGTVLPRGRLAPEIRTVLDFLGPMRADGRYEISFTTTL